MPSQTAQNLPPGYQLESPDDEQQPTQPSGLPEGYTIETNDDTPQNTGQVTNDVGNPVIVPKDGESFSDTMARAVQRGQSLSPAQKQDEVDKEMSTAGGKVATTLAAAPAIGAALAAPGALYDFAVKHLAGNVLPGMETEAAKRALATAIPKVTEFIDTMAKLGIGAGGLTYMLKALAGGHSK